MGKETTAEAINAEDHVGLVYKIAWEVQRTTGKFAPYDDLVGAGMLGLVEAAKRYDGMTASFSSFACPRIRGAIIDFMRSDTWIPRGTALLRKRLREMEEQTSGTTTNASEAELAVRLGISEARLRDVRMSERRARGMVKSIETNALSTATNDRHTAIPTAPRCEEPDERLVRSEMDEFVQASIDTLLSEREQFVIKEHFINERPLGEVATALGLGVSRTSKIKYAALTKLRVAIETHFQGKHKADTRRGREGAEAVRKVLATINK